MGIIRPCWKIQEMAYRTIVPNEYEDSKFVSTTFLDAPSAENTYEMLKSLELLHHAEKFGKLQSGPIWAKDSKTVSITFLGDSSAKNTPGMLKYLGLFPMLKN